MKPHTGCRGGGSCTGARLGSLLLTALASSCSSVSTATDYDPEFDFTSVRTFSWAEREGSAAVDDLNATRIRSAVEVALAAAGVAPSEAGSADVLVAFDVSVRDRVRVSESGEIYGYRYGGFVPRDVDVYQYRDGTLVVDLVDAEAGRLVWRGSARAALREDGSPERRTERIRSAVEALFADFPP